jgi:hypothetical protein
MRITKGVVVKVEKEKKKRILIASQVYNVFVFEIEIEPVE